MRLEVDCANPSCNARLTVHANATVGTIVCPYCQTATTAPLHQYCPRCGKHLTFCLVGERHRPRCDACGYVLYYNPSPGVAVLVVQDGCVLLVRRRSSVFNGMWCVPCGHVEADEDVKDAARREVLEETGLLVEIDDVHAVHSNFQIPGRPIVGIWFRGRIVGGELCPGSDAAEVRFFALEDLPPDLAFDTDRIVLERLRRDLLEGSLSADEPNQQRR